MWLWAAITASIFSAFSAISAASPVIVPSEFSVAALWVNAMTISAPSALAIGVHLSNVSTASRKSSPSTFSAFVLVTVSSPAIPIKAIFTPSLSVIM